MTTYYNSVVVLGRVAEDPKLKRRANGTPITTFSVLTNYRYSSDSRLPQDEPVAGTTSVNVEAHLRMAELCAQFLKKGRQVLLVGQLKTKGKKLLVGATEVKFFEEK